MGVPMSERRFRTNPVDAQVGNNVMANRIELGLSQDHIADQLGISLAEYQDCESGDRRFGPERLLRLARLLGVSPQHFFEGALNAASTKVFN
jgi:transcriptional regulator with XRE-family HTH domain